MSVVVLLDVAIPRGCMRFDRDAFHFRWPVGETVTRNGIFCREFHLILFGYEYRWAALDTLWIGPQGDMRIVSRGWVRS
jgi:hypothetical protein